MRVLFVSNLFPNSLEPARGTFNVRPVQLLQKHCDLRVVAPISWFPIPGRYAPPGYVPIREQIAGIEVHHPRALYLPKLCRPLNPFLFSQSLIRPLRALRAEFAFEHIHVDWLYPDACGVRRLARTFQIPFTVSVAGSDAVWYMNWHIRRQQILHTLREAAGTFTRSADLKNLLVRHGADANKIRVIYNGVDGDQYRPCLRADARRQLSLPAEAKLLIYVGRLSPEKGLSDLLKAFPLLQRQTSDGARLLVVGDGPLRTALRIEAEQLGVAHAVIWAGPQSPGNVPLYLSAADCLCLASHREGVPNVLLEANACGIPVVATRVGGVPEVVTEVTGILVPPHNPQALATSMTAALSRPWDATEIRRHALRFSWEDCAAQMYSLFQSSVHRPSSD